MGLLVRAEKNVSDEDGAYRRALCAHHATIAQAAARGQRLLAMVRSRQADARDRGLTNAEPCAIKELRGLAQSLRRDSAAVQMALSVERGCGGGLRAA